MWNWSGASGAAGPAWAAGTICATQAARAAGGAGAAGSAGATRAAGAAWAASGARAGTGAEAAAAHGSALLREHQERKKSHQVLHKVFTVGVACADTSSQILRLETQKALGRIQALCATSKSTHARTQTRAS